jgi:DNA-binding transcriptional MerR regulator
MVQSQGQWLKIGTVARRAGVSVDTVRYYERRGLLPQARRLPSGYRLYQEPAVARIQLTRRLQTLGMTLDEVTDALRAHEQGDATCDSERWRLEAVRNRIDARLAELTATREALESVLDHCAAGRCELRDAGMLRRP